MEERGSFDSWSPPGNTRKLNLSVELGFVHIKCCWKIDRALAGTGNLFVNAELFAIVGFVSCSWICSHNTGCWFPHLSEIFLSQTHTMSFLRLKTGSSFCGASPLGSLSSLPKWLWASHFLLLSFSFHICKMGAVRLHIKFGFVNSGEL